MRVVSHKKLKDFYESKGCEDSRVALARWYDIAEKAEWRNLSDIKADYLLLFFYNPDCHACQEISRQMESSFLINEFSKSNKLKILAVYPDEDLDAWKEHVSVMPKDWINSYDKSVSLKNDEIYDLKAIPTLYLLNKEKKVLLKDATFQQIENYLSQTTN